MDLKKMTFAQLVGVVESVWLEVKRRNPIGVNMYGGPFSAAAANLREIGKAEKSNPTCEAGPGVKKKREYKWHWAFDWKRKDEPFCGNGLFAATTPVKNDVTCLTCRRLMKLHGHLETV
jgi:hypothetical protein